MAVGIPWSQGIPGAGQSQPGLSEPPCGWPASLMASPRCLEQAMPQQHLSLHLLRFLSAQPHLCLQASCASSPSPEPEGMTAKAGHAPLREAFMTRGATRPGRSASEVEDGACPTFLAILLQVSCCRPPTTDNLNGRRTACWLTGQVSQVRFT